MGILPDLVLPVGRQLGDRTHPVDDVGVRPGQQARGQSEPSISRRPEGVDGQLDRIAQVSSTT